MGLNSDVAQAYAIGPAYRASDLKLIQLLGLVARGPTATKIAELDTQWLTFLTLGSS